MNRAFLVLARSTIPIMRWLIRHNTTRRWVNDFFNGLSWRGRYKFRRIYAKAFARHGCLPGDAVWQVKFSGRHLSVPLRNNTLNLDWRSALSICGHDVEVKQAYEQLVLGENPVDLFIDVGANFGTHTLLFLHAGIECLSFEPNPECSPRFQDMCRLNDVQGTLVMKALGATPGEITLYVPNGETWRGSINRLPNKGELTELTVQMTTLDDVLAGVQAHRPLLKIDAEGAELDILQGGVRTFAELRPLTIFETLPSGPARRELFTYFDSRGYEIFDLFKPDSTPLTIHDFEAGNGTNFIARPRGVCGEQGNS